MIYATDGHGGESIAMTINLSFTTVCRTHQSFVIRKEKRLPSVKKVDNIVHHDRIESSIRRMNRFPSKFAFVPRESECLCQCNQM